MKVERGVVLALATAGGLGYAPRAPGTAGTLAALPLWWACAGLPAWQFALVAGAVTAVAVAVSSRAERIFGGHDVQHIVIDEVAGMLVTVIGVPFAWPQVVAAFVLFRVLDMTKPWPIRWLDDNVGGGLGVVVDDVAAGAVACGLLHAAHLGLGGWW